MCKYLERIEKKVYETLKANRDFQDKDLEVYFRDILLLQII